jgi:hypothetical protein
MFFSLYLSLTPNSGGITHGVAAAPTYPALLYLQILFFVSEGSTSPQGPFLVFRNTLEIPNAHLTISSLMAFLSILLVVLSFPRRSCLLSPQFLKPQSLPVI